MTKPGNTARYLSIVTLILIAFCSLAFGQIAANQWTSHGPYGGAIRWFVIAPSNPNLIYAARADTSDIFKSVDGGVTWVIANSQMPDRYMDALAFDPTNANTIYAAALANGGRPYATIYKTTNGGVNWTAMNTLNYAARTTKLLIVDPQTSANLYAVGGQFFFQSVDGGANWNVFGPCLIDCGDEQTLAIDPNNSSILYVSFRDYQTLRRRLYKSTDRGATWHQSDVGLDVAQGDGRPLLAVVRGNSELIYATTTYYGDIFRSIDGGAHWSFVRDGRSGAANSGIDTFAVDPFNPNVAYAGTRGLGVLKTTDGGATWSQINTGLSNTFVYGLTIDPANGNHIFAATDGPGAFTSTNGGASWNEISVGQRSISVRSLATTGDPGVVYAGGMSVFKSANAGASWTTYAAVTTNSVVNSLVADPDNGNLVYALMAAYTGYGDEYGGGGGGVFKSTDGGVTWSAAQNGLVNVYVAKLLIDPTDHNTLYAASGNGLFKSTNAGASWNIIPGSVCCIIDFAISPANNRTIYASAYNGDYVSSIFKSTDGGSSFYNIGDTLPEYVGPLAVDPHNADVVYAISGSIFKSTDGGDNWSQISPASESFSSLVVDPNNSNHLFASEYGYESNSEGVSRSTDGGASWSSFSDGLNGDGFYSAVGKLVIDPSGRYLHLGTRSGVFSIEISPSIPQTNQIDNAEFFVRQHYLDFLNREPDAGGLAYWTARINECGSDAHCIHDRRVGVSVAFFIEQEFQDTGYFVYRFYKASLGRQPNYNEFNADRAKVIGGSNLEANKQAFADEWVQRPDFVSAFPVTMSATEFVNKLFNSAGLTTSIYDGQRQQEIQRLNGGVSRALVLRDVIEIADFKNIPDPNDPRYNELKQVSQYNPAFVLMQYFGYLRRNADPAGQAFWLDVVNNREPNNYRAMVCAFITSTEYQLRFGSAVTRSNADCGQ